MFSPWKQPALWNRRAEIQQTLDAVMHVLFWALLNRLCLMFKFGPKIQITMQHLSE
jgi:hypothetical protein